MSGPAGRGPTRIASNALENNGSSLPPKSLSQQIMEEEMKRQCMDLKKQIYNRWEENILTKNFFSPKTNLQPHNALPGKLARASSEEAEKSDNDAREDFVSATDVASKVIDEADSDGSVDFDGQAPNGELDEDSVMSQTQVFP